jgi:5-methylcytosine-specific restriction protein A
MAAIILAWNPDRWNDWNYTAVVEHVREAGQYHGTWSVASHLSVPVGADVWLLLQGRRGRGLLGHGVVVSALLCAPQSGEAARKSTLELVITFDSLLPRGDQIAPEILRETLPEVGWDGVRSLQTVGQAAEPKIRELWLRSGPAPLPDSALPVPGTYPAWAVSKVETNRYERDPEARRACIAHYGTSCAACGFSFEVGYGDVGRGVIDVHHTVPVLQLDNNYRLDPVTDLVPLCANCHTMAHVGVTTPRSLAELRRIVAGAGFIRGHTLQPDELESQQEAQRILGPGSG